MVKRDIVRFSRVSYDIFLTFMLNFFSLLRVFIRWTLVVGCKFVKSRVYLIQNKTLTKGAYTNDKSQNSKNSKFWPSIISVCIDNTSLLFELLVNISSINTKVSKSKISIIFTKIIWVKDFQNTLLPPGSPFWSFVYLPK